MNGNEEFSLVMEVRAIAIPWGMVNFYKN